MYTPLTSQNKMKFYYIENRQQNEKKKKFEKQKIKK